MDTQDTIAALSTPFGEGALAVIRLSGPQSIAVADKLWRGKRTVAELPARFAAFGKIVEGERVLDDVVLTVFRAPASYTGEDVVEISGHGGVLVSRRLLEALLRAGARSAESGEFTQRAYLHGKLDLTQAEAVMDLITAQSDLALRAAGEQLSGRLGERIRALKEHVLGILAHIEAYIDFPDEDISPDTGAALCARLDAALATIASLLDTAGQGRLLREGVRTVIAGEPNVGKSSLLNLLLGHERAIVSPRPGTTRDTLEETILLRGLPLRLVDTAGLRETDDEIERQGIARTHAQIQRADLVLRVHDATQPRSSDTPVAPPIARSAQSLSPESDLALRAETTATGVSQLLILNKTDLGEHPSWHGVEAVRLSCRTTTGLDALADAIEARVLGGAGSRTDWTVAINTRHAAHLETARNFLLAARRAFDTGTHSEFIAEELRAAMDAIGDIVGRAHTEDLLGVIFSSFCIGK